MYLTGATGSLGNAIIAAIIPNSTIAKVYCAIRGSKDRLVDSLRGRGYSTAVYESTKLHVVQYDLADPLLKMRMGGWRLR